MEHFGVHKIHLIREYSRHFGARDYETRGNPSKISKALIVATWLGAMEEQGELEAKTGDANVAISDALQRVSAFTVSEP